MSRRLILMLAAASLTALSLSVAPLSAASITILLDASYSMSLSEGDSTRLDRLAMRLATWTREQPADTRYALLVAEHGPTVRLEIPYPATARQVNSAVAAIVPWGSVDLGGAIVAAARTGTSIAEAAGDRLTHLLVVTDGEDISALTGGTWPRLPERVSLSTLMLQPRTAASVATNLNALATRTAVPEPEPSTSPPLPEPAARPEAEPSILVRWARVARWLFLAGTVLGLIAVFRAVARHRRRVAAVAAHNERPPSVELEIRGPSGSRVATVGAYPATLAAGAGSQLHPDLAQASPRVTFTHEDGVIRLVADEKVMINGVGRTEHPIAERNQIRMGSVRLLVREIAAPKPVRPPRPRYQLYPVAPVGAAVVAVVAFLLAAFGSVQAPAHASETRAEARAEARAERVVSRVPHLRLPIQVGPNDPIPSFDADYLAIHAHPDDESLDFGALLARMSAAGMQGGVLLLTDGASGLDQYPWRAVDDDYPAGDLSGESLARVRVGEAREAIGWLGADLYLRFGLPNHPYGSLAQVLSPAAVLDRWGGQDTLSRRVAEVIRTLRPRIVVAPGGPSAALEHFEHEATGIVVSQAIARLPEHDRPALVLRSVDPLQTEGYPHLHTVSPWTASPDATVPRLRQILALLAHRTQRDATVIGVETRMTLEHEFYVIDPLTVDRSLVAALGLRAVDLAGGRP